MLPAAYSPAIGVPSALSTRAYSSVTIPPEVPRHRAREIGNVGHWPRRIHPLAEFHIGPGLVADALAVRADNDDMRLAAFAGHVEAAICAVGQQRAGCPPGLIHAVGIRAQR